MLKRVVVAGAILLAGVSLSVIAASTYRGVAISELAQSMEDHRLISLTGDPARDKYIFAVTYPQWLADSADALRENTTTRAIRMDNLHTRFNDLYSEDPNSSFYRYYSRHAEYIKGNRTDRALEVGFCKNPNQDLSPYFYCFGYEGVVYRVIDAVDYLDLENHRIDRAWQYTPYSKGQYSDFKQPGPYGIYPTPKISGMGDEPKIFID